MFVGGSRTSYLLLITSTATAGVVLGGACVESLQRFYVTETILVNSYSTASEEVKFNISWGSMSADPLTSALPTANKQCYHLMSGKCQKLYCYVCCYGVYVQCATLLTHTHTHAGMHARTHTRMHTHTHAHAQHTRMHTHTHHNYQVRTRYNAITPMDTPDFSPFGRFNPQVAWDDTVNNLNNPQPPVAVINPLMSSLKCYRNSTTHFPNGFQVSLQVEDSV